MKVFCFGDLLVDQVDAYVQNRFTPRKSTCHLKIDGLKMKFPVEMVPFQGFLPVLGRVSDLCKFLESSSDITSGCQKDAWSTYLSLTYAPPPAIGHILRAY